MLGLDVAAIVWIYPQFSPGLAYRVYAQRFAPRRRGRAESVTGIRILLVDIEYTDIFDGFGGRLRPQLLANSCFYLQTQNSGLRALGTG